MVKAASVWKVHVHEPKRQKLHGARLWGSVDQNRKTKKTYLAFSLKLQNLLEFLKSHEYFPRSLDSKIWNFLVSDPKSEKVQRTGSCTSGDQNRKTKKTYLGSSLKFQNLLEFLKSHEYSLRSLDLKFWNFWSQIQKDKNFNELVHALP